MTYKKRDYLFDNIKFILIFLVVAVHLFGIVRSVTGPQEGVDLFLAATCSFHMPLFIFISGYFSKNLEKARERAGEILILYLLTQAAFVLYKVLVLQKPLPSFLGFLTPAFSMWYLFALFFYRFFLPELVKIKYILPVLFLVSIAVMKVFSGAGADFARTFANAFYFLLGYYATEEHIRKIRSKSKWIYGAMLISGIAGVYCLIHFKIIAPHLLKIIFLRMASVEKIDHGYWGYLIFASTIFFAVYMSVAVIGLTPEKKLSFSIFGKNTCTIYLGQAFLYKEFKRILTGSEDLLIGTLALYGVAFLLSCACVGIFGATPVAEGLQKCVRSIKQRTLKA